MVDMMKLAIFLPMLTSFETGSHVSMAGPELTL